MRAGRPQGLGPVTILGLSDRDPLQSVDLQDLHMSYLATPPNTPVRGTTFTSFPDDMPRYVPGYSRYKRRRVGSGSAALRRRGRSYTQTRRRSRTGTGVTAQHDTRVVYRKSRMPRYKRRRWARFCKKVNAALFKTVGTDTTLFNDALVVQTAADSAQQVIAEVALYGLAGSADLSTGRAGFRDVYTVVNNDPGNITSKFHFVSGVLDVTMKAATANTEPVEVDIYEVYCYGDTGQGSFNQALTDGDSNTPVILAGNTSITMSVRGATPFDIPQGISMARGTIVKKTKYLLPAGQAATYQVRDPKNHVVDKQWVVKQFNQVEYAWKKCTKVLYFVIKPVVGTTTQQTLNIGCTRKYSYKVIEQSTDADAVL